MARCFPLRRWNRLGCSDQERDYLPKNKAPVPGEENFTEVDLAVNLGGIALKNPLVAASGPFGYGREYGEIIDVKTLGGIVVKGVSEEPWPGNSAPRLAETASGLLNAIGLQNPGLDMFIREDLPRLRECGPRLVVNVIGRTVEEYVNVVSGLDNAGGIDGLELNISCPNLKAGGMAFGTDPRATAKVVGATRKRTSLPLIVKLTPNVTDISVIARSAEEAGADALSLVNTLGGMLIDVEKRKPLLGNTFGGLSGPAILPVALKMVWVAAGAVNIPILGMGGINCTEDALQFIMAGARAVALGTGLFYNPLLAEEIREGLIRYLQAEGLKNLGTLEGVARK